MSKLHLEKQLLLQKIQMHRELLGAERQALRNRLGKATSIASLLGSLPPLLRSAIRGDRKTLARRIAIILIPLALPMIVSALKKDGREPESS